jgi:hypothetical protein
MGARTAGNSRPPAGLASTKDGSDGGSARRYFLRLLRGLPGLGFGFSRQRGSLSPQLLLHIELFELSSQNILLSPPSLLMVSFVAVVPWQLVDSSTPPVDLAYVPGSEYSTEEPVLELDVSG